MFTFKRTKPTDPKRMRAALVAAAVLVLVAVPVLLLRRHENRYERVAHRITDGLVASDLSGVANDFTPGLQSHLTPHEIGKAAGALAPLGKLRSIREVTRKDAPPGTHDFVAAFEKAGVIEHLRLATGGKIDDFRFDDPKPY